MIELRRWSSFWLSAGLLLFCIGTANSTPSKAVDGLQLVVDPVTRSSAIDSLAPGETVQISAVVDRLSAVALQSFQIGLDHDSSLQPINLELNPAKAAVVQPTMTDVYVGLSSLLVAQEGPHVLATWTFVRLPGFAPDAPALIRLRNLENGEPSLYRSTAPSYHRAEFRDAGPVRIGSVGPGLWRFMATTSDFVAGRSYQVEWESSGLTDPTLNGVAVPASGHAEFVASGSTEHVLRYADATGSHERRIAGEVIHEPSIDTFEFAPPSTPDANVYRVSWKIRGATAVWWDPGPDFVAASGDRGVPVDGPDVITLRAENEWGVTTRSLVFSTNGEPAIALFSTEPPEIDLGQKSRLTWSVVHAESVSLTPPGGEVPADQSVFVQPDSTTTYVLRATGNDTFVEEAQTVVVIPVRIQQFSVGPDAVFPGDDVTLQWSIANADSAWIDPIVGPVDPSAGSLDVVPEDSLTVFTLHAARVGQVVTKQSSATWLPPMIVALRTHKSPTREDTTLEIEVEVRHADSVVVQPGDHRIVPPNASTIVSLPGTEPQMYWAYATNRGGTSKRSYKYPYQLPEIYTDVREARGAYLGGWTTLEVHTLAADSLEVRSSRILSTPYLQGVLSHWDRPKFSFWLDQPDTFVITAMSIAAETVDSVAVGVGETPFSELTVDDAVVARGDSTTIRWRVLDPYFRYSATLEPLGIQFAGEGGYGPLQGSCVVHPAATTQYQMVFVGYWDSSIRYRSLATVQVVDGESSLVAEPMNPAPGTSFDLHITMPGDATAASLGPDVGSIEPHSQTLRQIAVEARNYTLEVQTPRGIQRADLVISPEGAVTVPTLVTHVDLTGHARGSQVMLNWDVQALRSPESLRIERARGEDELGPWRRLGASQGETVDADVESGATYTYQLRFEIDGQSFESDRVTVQPTVRLQTRLLPNIPNPFNPSTRIRWSLSERGQTQLEIYDLRGRRLRSVDLGSQEAGSGSWLWDGCDDQGHRVASGAYIVRLESGTRALSQKVVLTK